MTKEELTDAQYRRAYTKFIKETRGWKGSLPKKIKDSIDKLSISTIKQRLQSAKKRSRDMSEAKKASKSRTIEQLKKDFVKVAKKLKIPEERIKNQIRWFKYDTKSTLESKVLYYEMQLEKLEKKQKK